MDPWGSCRAIILPARLSSYTGAVELSLVPCSWVLQFMCMEYATAQALSAGLTLPHNLYRTPSPPPLPVAVPAFAGSSGGAPEGYRLVRSGVTLGYTTLPAGAIFFSGAATYQQLGPLVNIVGRWRASGLDALRLVAARDASGVVEQAMANGTVTDYYGDATPASPQAATWAATPLPREDASGAGGLLRSSHVTRVEGCVSSTSVQRLLLVNAGGAAAAQGVTRCISNFAEEVVDGGFLAFVEGYYMDYSNSSNDAASVVQLWFVWAVPSQYWTAPTADRSAGAARAALPAAADAGSGAGAGWLYGTGGVRAIAPRLSPVAPTPLCSENRPMIPPEGVIGSRECGQSSMEQFACPSYMCCGTTRGRVGICDTAAAACLLSACDPRFGLCGVLPNEALEVTPHEGLMGVAPAPTPLSSGPPYLTEYGSETGSIATATVRYGASVYVLDKSSTVPYAAAVDACRSQTLYGLSWRLIMLPDAFSYEVTLLGRSSFLSQLDGNRVAWVQPRPDDSGQLGVPGCLTVTWDVDWGSVQLVAVQATECTSIASVICKATWPARGNSSNSSSSKSSSSSSSRSGSNGSDSGNLGPGSRSPSPAPPPPALQPRWTPGVHSLSISLVGINQANSGPSCVFDSFEGLPREKLLAAMAQVSVSQFSSPAPAPTPLGLNTSLDAPLAGIATRPLVTWSAVSSELPAAYEAVGAIALQYQPAGAAAPAPPLVLGSQDGTYLSPNASYGARAPSSPPSSSYDSAAGGLASYVSEAAGWRALQLDVAAGEVVVEVTGCRGALVEQLLLRTSAGRLWAAPIGPSLTCSVPFSRRAPPGGYLVAMQVFAGSFVEEVKLVWGTPPAAGAATTTTIAARRSTTRPVVFGVGVAFAVLVPVLVAGIVVIWWVRRLRHRRRLDAGKAATAAAAAAPSARKLAGDGGGGGGGCLELLGVLVERAGAALTQRVPDGCDAAAAKASEDSAGLGGDAGGGCADTPREVRDSGAGASPSSNTTTFSGGAGDRTFAPLLPDAAPPPPPQAAAADLTPPPALAAAGASLSATASSAMPGIGAGQGSFDRGGGSGVDGGGDAAAEPASSSAPRSEAKGHNAMSDARTGTGTGAGSDGGGSCAAAAAAYGTGSGQGTSCSESSGRSRPAAARDEVAAAAAAAAPAVMVPAWGPGPLPLPPPGSDAWAQNLHAALFYKVLYHWKPPSLATSLAMAGGFGGPGGLGAPGATPPAPHIAVAGAAGTAPSLAATSLVASSIAAPLTSSAAGGSAGSGGTHRFDGLAAAVPPPPPPPPSPPQLAQLATRSPPVSHAGSAAAAPAGGGGSSASQQSVPSPLGIAGPGTAGTGSASASAVPDGTWSMLTAAAAAAAGRGALSSDAARRSASDQTDTSAAAASAAAGPAGAATTAAVAAAAAAAAGAPGGGVYGAAPPQVTEGMGGEYDSSTELLLGRDVLVDVDDPSSYLGHGTSGVVRRGLLRQSDGSWRHVAVKLLNRPNDQAIESYRRHQKTLLQEITILGSLRHPNIVQLLGGSVSVQSGASFLVEELCGRTLSHAIYDVDTPYSLQQVLRWCCDIARGLAYLHPNIMHRDLKPSNVLLDRYGTAKISDFGLARFKIHTTLVTRDAEVGTTCYMSPECFVSNDFKVTAACDVYSLGVMMNEMVTRQPPWAGVRTAVVGFKVAVVGDRPRLPPEEGCELCPPGLRRLIQDCWAQQPEERPTSGQVLARLQVLLAELEAGAEAGAGARGGPGAEGGRVEVQLASEEDGEGPGARVAGEAGRET